MIFCFAILFGLSCVVVRMIYRRINWSKLMGNNVNKQRIENISDCPVSLDSRLKNAVSFDDGSARGERNSNCYYGSSKDNTM